MRRTAPIFTLLSFVTFALVPLAAGSLATGCLSDSGDTADAGDGGTTADGSSSGGDSSTPGSDGGDPGDGSTGGDGQAGDDPTANQNNKDSTTDITYLDDLSKHPGCTTAGLDARVAVDGTAAGYTAAALPNFPCAAKEYAPATDDPKKPIILLVHGNSSTPLDWETYSGDTNKTPMIAETLVADGYHVYAADFRYDKVPDPTDTTTGNPAKNFDHGWATPILQGLVASLVQKYPNQKINMAGFSLGTTIIRDALRRMQRAGKHPFEHVHSLLLASGANHGVSTFASLCNDVNNPANKTLRGLVACQLGNRDAYDPVPFLIPLNGDSGSFETPCADGNTAFGQRGVCGGNKVVYTTVVFQDPPSGPLQDEFVSQTSAKLAGADNKTVDQVDSTKYFINGLFQHHYGAIRSAEGIAIAKAALEQ